MGGSVPLPVTAGFRIVLINPDSLVLDEAKSGWNMPWVNGFIFQAFRYSRTTGMPRSADYRIEFFDEVGADTSVLAAISSTRTLQAVPLNFKVYNESTGERVKVAFYERDGDDNMFSAFVERSQSDLIIFLEPDENDSLEFTWEFSLDVATNDSLHRNPVGGDVVELNLRKPFMSHDVLEFTTVREHIDAGKAKVDIAQIRVVPNPYVVSNSWEPLNPYSNGRGPRELHFIHLPSKCTIRIFNIRGQLVRTLEHDTPSITDGTEIWDMQTKDQLDISYGVYVYHVDAGSIGQKTGKFAVVK